MPVLPHRLRRAVPGRALPGRCFRHRAPTLLAALLVALAAGPRPAQAVTYHEQIDRHKEVFALLLDYRAGQAPEPPQASLRSVALELIPLPAIDTRVGAKDEPVAPPPAIPRLRFRRTYGRGLAVGLTAGPRLPVGGYRAGWLGAEVGYRVALGPAVGAVRGYALAASVEGPITAAGSRDTFALRSQGLDVRVGWKPAANWRLYGGAGRGKARSKLTIAADGATFDGTRGRNFAFAGLDWVRGPWQLGLEQHVNGPVLAHLIVSAAFRY